METFSECSKSTLRKLLDQAFLEPSRPLLSTWSNSFQIIQEFLEGSLMAFRPSRSPPTPAASRFSHRLSNSWLRTPKHLQNASKCIEMVHLASVPAKFSREDMKIWSSMATEPSGFRIVPNESIQITVNFSVRFCMPFFPRSKGGFSGRLLLRCKGCRQGCFWAQKVRTFLEPSSPLDGNGNARMILSIWWWFTNPGKVKTKMFPGFQTWAFPSWTPYLTLVVILNPKKNWWWCRSDINWGRLWDVLDRLNGDFRVWIDIKCWTQLIVLEWDWNILELDCWVPDWNDSQGRLSWRSTILPFKTLEISPREIQHGNWEYPI